MTKRDYYEVLDIGKDAGKDEIKKAYRKLARKYHPDVNKDAGAEDKFKEMSEAYEVLADDNKKANYDGLGHAGAQAGFSGGGFSWDDFSHFDDISDIFGRDFFGRDIFDVFFGGQGRRRGSSAKRGSDVRYDVEIDLEGAAFGVEKEISVRRNETCDECSGTGAKSPSDIVSCPTCGGAGQLKQARRPPFGQFVTVTACIESKGAGRIIKKPCTRCEGTGRKSRSRKMSVNIPAGVESGSYLKLREEGDSGMKGGSSGDLYVVIHVKPHNEFRREGSDIVFELPISFSQAALGDEVEVPTLQERVTMRIPAGTQTGTLFKLKGEGIHKLHGRGRGDELVRVQVVTPDKLSGRHKELFRELMGKKEGKGVVESIKEKLNV
ncbi:MAG: molecular chaperone DnaJ [Candidatus Altiarchaeales archaeon]|nr:molecular chaperone DnaJ [Candidatus Altiarchaeales archaeon]